MLESLFYKVVDLKACDFVKKRLQHRYSTVSIAKFLRTGFFIEHLRWLLRIVTLIFKTLTEKVSKKRLQSKLQKKSLSRGSRCSHMFYKTGASRNFAKFPGKCLFWNPATFLKERLRHRYFLVNFASILKRRFLQNASQWQLLLKAFSKKCVTVKVLPRRLFIKKVCCSSSGTCNSTKNEPPSIKHPSRYSSKVFFVIFGKYMQVCWKKQSYNSIDCELEKALKLMIGNVKSFWIYPIHQSPNYKSKFSENVTWTN